MRPMTAAPSAASSTLGSSACVTDAPITPLRRKSVTYASTPTIAHSTLCSRRTGIPSSAARSALSAVARSAVPTAEKRKKPTSAASTIGTTMSTRISLPLKVVTPTWNDNDSSFGSLNSFVLADPARQEQRDAEQDLGDADRRDGGDEAGRWKKRRRNRNSTRTPSKIAAARPVAVARK